MTPDKPTAYYNGRIVSNRSEAVYVFDGEHTNQNGNPLSPSNKPRIDPVTNQGIATDVRIKRYIRDEFATLTDEANVYIDNVRTPAGNRKTRVELARSIFEEIIGDISDPDDIEEGMMEEFLKQAIDVRYFGATFSLSTNDEAIADRIDEVLPKSLEGPVQFSPARTLHPVRENTNSNSLTSVVSNPGDEDDTSGNETGGFDLDDHRIVYGLFATSAVINEHVANDTLLTEDDVERLDEAVWKSLKNQASSRSKQGQNPRLYLRVEYEEGFHSGNLDSALQLGDESDPAEELTTVYDTSLDLTRLTDELKRHTNRVKEIHVLHDKRLQLEDNGETIDTELPEYLRDELGVDVHAISLFD